MLALARMEVGHKSSTAKVANKHEKRDGKLTTFFVLFCVISWMMISLRNLPLSYSYEASSMKPLLMLSTLAVLTLSFTATGSDQDKEQKPNPKSRGIVKLTEEALKIHNEAIVIDGHNDLPWATRPKKGNPFTPIIDLTKPQPKLHTDIPRLRKGNVGAQFWSAYVPSDTMKKGTSIKLTLEQIDRIHRMVQKYPDVFEMASTADDIIRIRKTGKIASMIGVEGGHSIDDSIGVLRTFYALGVRYMTLTHSANLDWCDSATDTPKLKGLNEFGEQVILEMNRLGMLVDISHISADAMRHTLKVTKAPVIASHSSAYAIASHPRNVPDDVLKLVKTNGGVIMVNFYSAFILPDAAKKTNELLKITQELRAKYKDDDQFQDALAAWKKANPTGKGTVHDVVDHIEHIIKVAGIDHVGLGSDYDGISQCPLQLEDVSCYPYITQVLINRGYSREDIHKVLGGNLIRVMRETEKVANGLQ